MAKRRYKAILFHPEGDCVTDFHGKKSIKEVWDEINDMGSRWIFYPIVLIASDNTARKLTTIVDTANGLEYFTRRKASTVQKYLAEQWNDRKDEICNDINNGLPWEMVYPDLPQPLPELF